MVPEQLYKRRRNHNNTPKSLLLIMANCITVLVCTSLFTNCTKITNFFWIAMAGLAVYNYFTIRRFHYEFNRVTIVAYIASLVALIALVIVFRVTGQGC